MDEKFLKN